MKRDNFEDVKRAYKLLTRANFIIVFIALLLFWTGLLKDRVFYAIVAMLPLDLYIFSWIFHDVVSWGAVRGKRDNSRFLYIGDGAGVILLLLLDGIFALMPLIWDAQCIRGQNYIYTTVAILSAFLFSVTLFTMRKQNDRIIKCVIVAWLTICFAFPMAFAFYYATTSHPVSYITVVWDSKAYFSRGWHYRIKVMLRDGSFEWLYADEELYSEVKNGGTVMIHERSGILGTQFVKVRLPG